MWSTRRRRSLWCLGAGCCDKPMQNQVESHPDDAMADHDMVTLLRIIKDAAYDANDRKYPSMQAARAWKNLAFCRQGENESLLDFYTRFISLIEMVERSYGPVAPEEIAKGWTGNDDDRSVGWCG